MGFEESTIASDKLMSSFRQWGRWTMPRNRVNKLVNPVDSSTLVELNGPDWFLSNERIAVIILDDYYSSLYCPFTGVSFSWI